MNNLLLDTNVFIYALDNSSKFHNKSVELFENIDNNLFITTKNISEYFSVCSKLKFEINKALGFYADIKANFTILFPNEVSLNIFESLFKKYSPHGNRVYDIEIVSIMIASGLNKIATANVSDFNSIDEIEIIEIN